jgi:hypothetical protein
MDKKILQRRSAGKDRRTGKDFYSGNAGQGPQDWNDLIRDIETAISSHEDPVSAKSRKLAERWSSFTRGFTGGDPEVEKGLNKLYADPAGWPASFKKPWSDDLEAFIKKAMAAHKISCT